MKKFAWLLLFSGVVGLSLSLQAQQTPADIILTNGKIITVNDTFQIAQAVAVRGARIIAVGSNADITRLAGPNTQRIDLRGKSMVPGFIDNHAHFQEEGAYWTLELRFDGVDTRKQALELIRAKAQASGPGKWVYALGGWSPDQFMDNKKPFTLMAKITPTFLKTYDAGTLYIWVKDDLWLKMAMEMDERGKHRMVSVRTTGTSDDNNHDVITAKSVYMKISSDTKTVGFYYSLDKKSWQLIRLFKNDYPETIWMGISTQSPLGEGTSVLFEDVILTHQSISDFRLGQGN